MLAIRIELLAGRYHATPWGRAANEGDVEWPPSPWRLARALVDAWYRLDPGARPTEDEVDSALAALLVPPRFVLPKAVACHSRHYMPLASHGPKVETRLVLDAFVRAAPGPVVLVWPEDADAEVRATLAILLAAVGYLGRAESPCVAELSEPPAGSTDAFPLAEAGESDEGEIVRLLCLDSSASVAALSVSSGELRRRRSTKPPAGRFIEYLRPNEALEPPPRRQGDAARRKAVPVELVRMALESPCCPR